MQRNFISQKELLKIIIIIGAIVQIITGFGQVYFITLKLAKYEEFDLIINVIKGLPFIILSFIAGIKILSEKSSKSLLFSITNYVLQLFQFKLLGFRFFYIVGPYLGFGIVKNTGQPLTEYFETSIFAGYIIIEFVQDKTGFFLTMNIVSFLFLAAFIKEYISRRKNEDKRKTISVND